MIVISSLSSALSTGFCEFKGRRWPCQLGKAGRSVFKSEGDGASPGGIFALKEVYYRPDRRRRPQTLLPVRRIRPDMGWCDAPEDRNYNRPVRLPYPASHEKLWRDDHVYDLLVTLSHNERPRGMYRGSAVFIHVSSPENRPTQGCIALGYGHIEQLLKMVSGGEHIWI